MKYKFTLATISLFCLLQISVFAQPAIVIKPYVTGFTRPVKIANAGDARLFVAEIGGKIKIIKNGTILSTPFLDIGSKVNDPEWAGIFSIAFHPQYQSNGFFYVMYVVKNKFEVQISRFQRQGNADSDIANAAETLILTIPYTDVLGGHRGGDLAFGKDNQLYISTGDNGPGSRGVIGDPESNSQNMSKLFGKLLKIDPASPPTAANATQNIWALGLRNPWRFSFDRSNGDLWIGDNGQDGWEEINYLSASSTRTPRNFGWDYMEGNAVYRNCNCNIVNTFIAPKLTYPGYTNNQNKSASVMGGYVYRGSQYPSLKGTYFYGDYQSFQIGAITSNGYHDFIPDVSYSSLISFGEDQSGELYVASFLDGTLGTITLPGDPLTAKLKFFTAKTQDDGIQLDWETSMETNFSRFILERSGDGKKFSALSTIPSSPASKTYGYLDKTAFFSLNYYRLKLIDNDGSFQISKMVVASQEYKLPEIIAYPNPGIDKFDMQNAGPGNVIRIYNTSGILILTKRITSVKDADVNLKGFPSGTYITVIQDENGRTIKKSKLIKN
jgi:glucose/arabinose dehydrogenase